MSKFLLEIYEPDSESLVLASVETQSAITMLVGEVIQTGVMVTDRLNMSLKITRVEHILWKSAAGWSPSVS